MTTWHSPNHTTRLPCHRISRDLQALAREAQFYSLPGLVEHIQNTSLMPQPGTRTFYDSLYLETGFKSIEGPSLKEMEKCKVVVMQQMNHVLSLRSQDGFYVDNFSCGVNHKAGPDGAMQHNLYYNILLKKVVPLLPRRPGNQQQQQQQHQQMQQQMQQQQQQQLQQQQQQQLQQQQQQQHPQQQAPLMSSGMPGGVGGGDAVPSRSGY